MYNLDDGIFLVKLARQTIQEYLRDNSIKKTPENTPPQLQERGGAFVTLKRRTEGGLELRGCIGLVLPIHPLVETVIKMAIAAATQDPRFPRVQSKELSELVVEVSCLTPPKEILTTSPRERSKKVTVGIDGLIVERNGRSGLLLPQVPIERGWDEIKFLQQTSIKAGLPPSAWMDTKTTVQTFQAKVFSEEAPNGKISEVPLNAN